MFNATLGKIEYSDDAEYRICIGKIFSVPETLVDDYTFEPVFEYIYEKTKDDAYFQHIYSVAAGFMMSEDKQTGICVLFSYDYAAAFYAVLCAYINGESEDILTNCKGNLKGNLRFPLEPSL